MKISWEPRPYITVNGREISRYLMIEKLKQFFLYATVQFAGYTIIVYNFRVIAAGNVQAALISDIIYASLQFFVIRHIAKERDETSYWAFSGYVTGSALGTLLGMHL